MPNPALLRAEAPPGGAATPAGLRPSTALVVAFAHLGVIAAAAIALPGRIVAFRPQAALSIVFEPPAPPAPPQMLAAGTLPAPAVSVTTALSRIAPLNLPADTHAPLPRAARRYDAPRPSQAVQQTTVVQPEAATNTRAAASHLAPPAPSPRVLDAWEAQVHQAVQDALAYPSAARLMRREGRTRVRFEYGHDAVSSVSVAESSGFSVLDQAALGAVTRAAIPAPPPEIAGQTRSLILWVSFSLTAEDR